MAMIAIEMGWFSHRFIRPRQVHEILEKEYPKTKEIQFLQEHAGLNRVLLPDDTIGWAYRKAHPELFPNRLMAYGLYTVRGYDQTFLRSYAEYIYGMQGIKDDRFLNVFLNIFDPARIPPPFLCALGVKYVVTPESVQAKGFKLVSDDGPLIFEFEHAFPKAFVLPENLAIPSALPMDSTAEILHYSPNEVRIHCVMDSLGWLVVSDNYYPEWTGEANGRPVEIHPVLGTFRGIHLGAGEWDVVMKYNPQSLKKGLVISLGTLLVLLWTSIIAVWRRK